MSPSTARVLAPSAPAETAVIGAASLVKLAFQQADLMPIWSALMARAAQNASDAAALFDMSVILQVTGQPDNAAAVQNQALAISRRFVKTFGSGGGPKILALMTAGNFMANTPIEFLLDGSDARLVMHFVDAGSRSLGDVSGHDMIFVAVGESEANLPVLANIARLMEGIDLPAMNNAPAAIAALTRDGVARTLAGEASVLAPEVRRVHRGETVTEFPIVIRPLASHAGQGLERIASAEELAAYYAAHAEPAFFVSPFIDYAGADGYFRKYRVAVIDGVPFASHMAVSRNWMVHYLNAGMTDHPERRAEEASWMAGFAQDFALRHAAAFAAMHRKLGLDYFGIDCAELADGRLLLFEADVAMIVHDMDPVDVFPYKKPAMKRLLEAFWRALEKRKA
jgi:glutathione synthase/RimK-type ligase-like ATP-grasp enzyme